MSRIDDLFFRPLRLVRRRALRILVQRRQQPITFFASLTVAVWFVFLIFPSIDVRFARLFFEDSKGFALQHSPFLRNIRAFSIDVETYVAVSALAVLVFPLVTAGERLLIPARRGLFLLSSLALGPGLLVNSILKAASGRPRPRDIVEFGGNLPFVPAGVFSQLCNTNCSFVSGEASSAAWLLAVAFVVPRSWRRGTLKLALCLAIPFSLNRMAFGGHFLSDVLISWGLTIILILLCNRAILGGGPAHDDAFDRALGEVGKSIWRATRRLGRAGT